MIQTEWWMETVPKQQLPYLNKTETERHRFKISKFLTDNITFIDIIIKLLKDNNETQRYHSQKGLLPSKE